MSATWFSIEKSTPFYHGTGREPFLFVLRDYRHVDWLLSA
jgi:hypothetical protein